MKAKAAAFSGIRKPFEIREYELPEVEERGALGAAIEFLDKNKDRLLVPFLRESLPYRAGMHKQALFLRKGNHSVFNAL